MRDGVAEKLVGVKEHPFTRGGLCAKVSHFLERTYSPDRLRQPLMRTGPKGSGAFEPVAWDVALAHIAERLGAIAVTVLLFFVPKLAFADTAPEEGVAEVPTPVG